MACPPAGRRRRGRVAPTSPVAPPLLSAADGIGGCGVGGDTLAAKTAVDDVASGAMSSFRQWVRTAPGGSDADRGSRETSGNGGDMAAVQVRMATEASAVGLAGGGNAPAPTSAYPRLPQVKGGHLFFGSCVFLILLALLILLPIQGQPQLRDTPAQGHPVQLRDIPYSTRNGSRVHQLCSTFSTHDLQRKYYT